MYLILAREDDLHADAVAWYLQKRGARVLRFDPPQLFEATRTAGEDSLIEGGEDGRSEGSAERTGGAVVRLGVDSGVMILPDGSSFETSQVHGVLARSYLIEHSCSDAALPYQLSCAEIRSTLRGLWQLMPAARWVNHPVAEDIADNKIYQHSLAKRLGFKVPDTLVTNDAVALSEFAQAHPQGLIIKQLSDVSLIESVREGSDRDGLPSDTLFYGFYTHALSKDDLAKSAACLMPGAVPCLFQELLPKRVELRVAVVGERCFAVELHSQECARAQVDFRRGEEVPQSPVKLEQELARRLVDLVRALGLIFAACDLVITPQGEVYFLEANVSGNYLWHEEPGKSPISEAIAGELIKI